jgi:UDP-glucose 4-epimerase
VKALEQINETDPILRVYNLGTGKGTSVKELIGIFEKVNNVVLKQKYSARREGDLPIVYANTDRANTELGWNCIYTLEDMCKHGYNYALANF